MAPARTANRRGQRDQNAPTHNAPTDSVPDPSKEIFLDPMMGTPLQIYVEKDVENKEAVENLIKEHGGIVSQGYSSVPYILVNPHRESGQSLFRQYVGKKGKIVLDAKWAYECVKAGAVQTYQDDWAGCKVTGKEQVLPASQNAETQAGPSSGDAGENDIAQPMPPTLPPPPAVLQQQPPHVPPMLPPPISASSSDPLLPHPHPHPHPPPYTFYPPPHVDSRGMPPPPVLHPPSVHPPQTWHEGGIAPQQTQTNAPPPPPAHIMPHEAYRGPHEWSSPYHHPPPPAVPPPAAMIAGQPPYQEYRYGQEQRPWPPTDYYPEQQYDQAYNEDAYMDEAGPSNDDLSTTAISSEKMRGRKRIRTQPQPAPPASTLVLNRRNPPARSPTPPTRVIKSTYGGNLFTSDDVLYLKRYIDYCQEQGLVLSLREICERIAVKAPHHTFYSWRRYCNKHQIRLGGYAMDVRDAEDDHGRGEQPSEQGQGQAEDESHAPLPGAGPDTIAAARRAVAADINRTRSPTPPRALFRSTTGKGVAFTDEDVTFLVRFLEYRNRTQGGKMDMVSFWKDVASKAPHHSRASWMKFYRRHKHELHHTEGDAPLPAPPEKKMRYSRSDDVLLAKYFFHKPEGTSDKIFQEFGRMQPHHPWKGWQEHHRIHKAKIDHLIQQLANGENIEVGPDD
ncbi:uncharacterized protein LAESUDRAFT_672779 [Laetiporus sulphureus 93-53]|uniref:BRCT domain-containing protein n=1 Tax=Laetiporus sulphureus 93-53 TaxID=1314785 RepID=A0A165H085_9APHY|nr:uncharacterized protein LAESUDRAFT_672779 [Laetiporus sulphureus 93-53]KZT11070.1 hypothetical protein LAESUDRAFT_672779 [Laetiporus sulphureus 93-53]